MYREGNDVFLTEEELCGAILHFLRAQGPSFSVGMGHGVVVRPAPVIKNGTRFDFQVKPAPIVAQPEAVA